MDLTQPTWQPNELSRRVDTMITTLSEQDLLCVGSDLVSSYPGVCHVIHWLWLKFIHRYRPSNNFVTYDLVGLCILNFLIGAWIRFRKFWKDSHDYYTVCFNLTEQNCDFRLNWSSGEMKNYTQLVNEGPWKIMIGLSHYRDCGLYDATLMTGKLVSRSKQIDSELSDFRNQLNELMQSFNTVMWPGVRWQSIWHWCKVIWCPQNDPGGNKTLKMAIKVHNKRTTGSIHIIAAYNGEIQGSFHSVCDVQLLYQVVLLWGAIPIFPVFLIVCPKRLFLEPKMSSCFLWHNNAYKLFVSEVLCYIPIYTNLSMTFIMLDSKGPLSLYVKGKSESPLLLENAGDAKVMPTIEMCGQLQFIMR